MAAISKYVITYQRPSLGCSVRSPALWEQHSPVSQCSMVQEGRGLLGPATEPSLLPQKYPVSTHRDQCSQSGMGVQGTSSTLHLPTLGYTQER